MIVPFFGSIISVHFSNCCSVHIFLQAKWSTLSLFFGTKTLNSKFERGFQRGVVRSGVTCPVKPCLMISEVPWGTGPSSYSSLISGSYASITQLFLDDSSVLKNTDWRLQLRPPATNLNEILWKTIPNPTQIKLPGMFWIEIMWRRGDWLKFKLLSVSELFSVFNSWINLPNCESISRTWV